MKLKKRLGSLVLSLTMLAVAKLQANIVSDNTRDAALFLSFIFLPPPFSIDTKRQP